jgi:Ca2+-binding EF-hand superfamily protein
MRTLLVACSGFVVMSGLALGQNVAPARGGVQPAQGVAPSVAGAADQHLNVTEHMQGLEDHLRAIFKLVDTNNDNQISQKEAIDAGNLLAGGFFFRADANGDGKITQEEARQAREALFQQQPLTKVFFERAKAARDQRGNRSSTDEKDPIHKVAGSLDTNKDKQLDATEVRHAVESTVQGVFAAADTNRDGQLSPAELNTAAITTARAAAQAAFQNADTDKNGALSKEEYHKALVEPADVAFTVMDANGDGQLSQDELRAARRAIMEQLRMLQVPEPSNSVANVIRSGRSPEPGSVPETRVAPPARTPR